MKKLIILVFLISLPLFAGDFEVECKPWEANNKNFSLIMEVEKGSSTYIDAWIDMKVFEDGVQVHSLSYAWAHGHLFYDNLGGVRVPVLELIPAGGNDEYKFDFLSIAADHPLPLGNSFLTYKGGEYQAECFIQK